MKELEQEFMSYLCMMGKVYGLEDVPLKVFGILFLEPEEISMEEIAQKTGYSLASISNSMRFLESIGQVDRIRKPGSKKVYFRLDKDLVKWNIRKLEVLQQVTMRQAKEKLPPLIKKYHEKARTPEDKKKVEIIDYYYRQILLFEKITNRWKKELEDIELHYGKEEHRH